MPKKPKPLTTKTATDYRSHLVHQPPLRIVPSKIKTTPVPKW